MAWSKVEKLILGRFAEKCRIAGGPRPGFVLRRDSVAYHAQRHPELDFDQGLAGLVGKGVLAANETGDRFALTQEGSDLMAQVG